MGGRRRGGRRRGGRRGWWTRSLIGWGARRGHLLIGRLVLGDRVDQGVAGARVLDEETPHARREGAKVTGGVEQEADEREEKRRGDGNLEAEVEVLRGGEAAAAALHLAELEELEAEEDEEWRELLEGLERVQTDHRHSGRAERAEDEKERVGAVQLGSVPRVGVRVWVGVWVGCG